MAHFVDLYFIINNKKHNFISTLKISLWFPVIAQNILSACCTEWSQKLRTACNSSGLEKTTYLQWSLNSQTLVGHAIQTSLTIYWRKIKCISQEKKRKLEIYALFIFFPLPPPLFLISNSFLIRLCEEISVDWPKNSCSTRLLLASHQPGFVDSWGR